MSVASDRAQVVTSGVSSPASTSVVSSATIRTMTAPGRGRLRTDRGAADPAEEKNREQHDAEPVDGMSEKDHQPLHLRYLDQHEAHADRAEIGHRRRQRRQRHPPRKTDEGHARCNSTQAQSATMISSSGHADRRVVVR